MEATLILNSTPSSVKVKELADSKTSQLGLKKIGGYFEYNH